MATGLILMIVLGCSDAGDQCERVAATATSYANMAQCQAAVAIELPRQTGIAYPVIGAHCEPGPAPIVTASIGN